MQPSPNAIAHQSQVDTSLSFCLVLRCVALRNLRSPAFHTSAVCVCVYLVLLIFRLLLQSAFCRSMRYTYTLSTLLLLLPLLLRPPLTLARTYLPLVYPTLLPPMSMLFVFLCFPPPSSRHTAPLDILPGMQCGGGRAWSARTRHGTLRRCRRVCGKPSGL